MRIRSILLLVWIPFVAFCRTGEARSGGENASVLDARSTGTTDTVSAALMLVTSRIDTTITLGGWLKAHPEDTVSGVAAISGVDDPFCRSAVGQMNLSGHTVARHAMFYIPAPPAGEQLPQDAARFADDLCVLRTFWITTPVVDSVQANLLADSLALAMDARLGVHKSGQDVSTHGAGNWQSGRTWAVPGTTVVLAITSADEKRTFHPSDEEESDGAASSPATAGRVVAITAYAPGSGVQDFDSWERLHDQAAPELAEAARTAYPSADSALMLAQLPLIANDLRMVLTAVRRGNEKAVLDEARRTKGKPLPAREPLPYAILLRALKAVRDTAPSLKPPQRAAALAAADIILNASLPYLDADTTAPLFRSLDSLGIRYEYSPLGAVYSNPRSWLWEAYRLDSLGRAGHIAFIELLSAGWSTRAQCADGAEQFAKIIEHGEAALRRGDTDPMVHYYVGIGYKTIFDLAQSDPRSEYVDPKSYEPRAEQARLRSIEHFRAALSSLRDRSVRRDAWDMGIRLMLKLGSAPRYFCVYD